MSNHAKQIDTNHLPDPKQCGFEIAFEDNHLVIHIRKTFDKENRGKDWAKIIVETFTVPYERIIIDFGRNSIVSTHIYPGLIELYQGFHDRSEEDLHIRNCSEPILHALQMFDLTQFFIISMQKNHHMEKVRPPIVD